ncbi:MAG: peptide chain release factor N(5)-glutamine methyltransferase [Anaerolineales bacterium]
MNIKAALMKGADQARRWSETPQLDAQVLAAHLLNQPRAWLMARLDEELTAEQVEKFQRAFKELGAGKPLPYVLGSWEFFGLSFEVTEDVLIPRPETELLVEHALRWLKENPAARRVADVGCGSGVIAVSIAAHAAPVKILATDVSPAALQIAERNAQKHNVQTQIEFVECDLLPTFQLSNFQPFNLLCSNPPYIPTEALRALSIYGREPTLALDGGLDGLDFYRRLFEIAPRYLHPRGALLLEIESTLGAQTAALASQSFPNAKINLYPDLAGKDRLLEVQTTE